MKVGEIWKLKAHHESELLRYAGEARLQALAIVVKIIRLYNDKVHFEDTQLNANGTIYECIWTREQFIGAYQKAYDESR